MKHCIHVALAAVASATLATAAALAAPATAADDQAGHHATPTPREAATAAGAATAGAATQPNSTATPMDHGNMKMQGGPAPADARDPHAESGGYTLETGPYGLGGPRQLRLDDESIFATVLFDNLEAVRSHGHTRGAYDVAARVGRDYDRLVVKAEGEVSGGKLQEARSEALWSHAVATFWDAQLGLRYDGGVGPGRGWLAVGVQGLAPYWFELDATAYVGDSGRSALRLDAEYDLRVTQRLIMQPRVEANLQGKSDPARDLGSGLSDITAGLRLRYEFSRQFAPYVGVEWVGRFGETADLARAAGERARETRLLAGVRIWF